MQRQIRTTTSASNHHGLPKPLGVNAASWQKLLCPGNIRQSVQTCDYVLPRDRKNKRASLRFRSNENRSALSAKPVSVPRVAKLNRYLPLNALKSRPAAFSGFNNGLGADKKTNAIAQVIIRSRRCYSVVSEIRFWRKNKIIARKSKQ